MMALLYAGLRSRRWQVFHLRKAAGNFQEVSKMLGHYRLRAVVTQ